ncbi:hypothetical protein MPPM_0933 [Methylorubrum populi]|uniref:Uncharacterized protein n=1 Tax=Methylorubrum populi TaxID=223967 RepID=A0A161JKD6_9HYPH|nr:hypothetical protein [Methylorubrum populi]BAU89538.1 hypothetical protein MPPM_0933 [Methylorubrum populi]
MRAASQTAFPTAGLAASRLWPTGRHRVRAPARHTEPEPKSCGGESVINFALCLILAVAVVGLLVLAL